MHPSPSYGSDKHGPTIYTFIFMHVMAHCTIDPAGITTVEVTGRCTNDFTLSWTAASNEERLSYTLSLVPDGTAINPEMNTSYNVTGLMPDTTYTVSVYGRLIACLGIPYVTTVTTLTVAAGVPQGELIVMLCIMTTFKVSALN